MHLCKHFGLISYLLSSSQRWFLTFVPTMADLKKKFSIVSPTNESSLVCSSVGKNWQTGPHHYTYVRFGIIFISFQNAFHVSSLDV
jgi:alpha-tubulin suppressor-like RCC1 family protein